MTQTAVQWLIEVMGDDMPQFFQVEALSMEKEQIKKAFSDGINIPLYEDDLSNEYYNINYGIKGLPGGNK